MLQMRTGANDYELDLQCELAFMANLFFTAWERKLFYLTLVVRFGCSLCRCTFMETAVPKLLQKVSTTFPILPIAALLAAHCAGGAKGEGGCIGGLEYATAYRAYLALFIAIIGPFTLFDVSKTKVCLFVCLARGGSFRFPLRQFACADNDTFS